MEVFVTLAGIKQQLRPSVTVSLARDTVSHPIVNKQSH